MLFRNLIISGVCLSFLIGGCATKSVYSVPEHPTQNPRAVALFIDGLNYELDQNYPAALLMYQEALLYDTTSATLYFNVGKNYLRLGKQESAMLALKRCIELDPDQKDAWNMLVTIYAGQGWWDLVEKTYLSMLERDSTDIAILQKLGIFYLKSKEPEKATFIYERLNKLQTPPDPKNLIALGEIYFDLNRFDRAESMFRQLILQEPESGFGYFGLGITLEAAGDTAGAVFQYQKALEKTGQLNDARVRLGKIYTNRKAWRQAAGFYQEAVRIDSTDLKSWLELCDVYMQAGDSLKADSLYQNVQLRFPAAWQVYFNYGRFLMRQQAWDKAHRVFREVNTLAPENAWGWLFSGITAAHQDSLDAAERDLSHALSMDLNDPLGYYYLGTVYIQQKAYEKAIPALKRALLLQADWVSAMGALGSAYENLGMVHQADSLFQAALNIEPDNALMLNNYAYSLSLRGERLDDALAMATRALAYAPENGAYLDTVGWIHFLMGHHEEALNFIRKAAESRLDSFEVFDHLGDVFAALNQPEKAREAWTRALELDASNSGIREKLGLPGQ